MTTNHQSSDVDAHGANIRAPAAAPEAEHQAVVRMVLAAASSSYMDKRTRSGKSRNSLGAMAGSDSRVGSSWVSLAGDDDDKYLEPTYMRYPHRGIRSMAFETALLN